MIKVELDDFIRCVRDLENCENVSLAKLLKVELNCDDFSRCEDCSEFLIKTAKDLNLEDEAKDIAEEMVKRTEEVTKAMENLRKVIKKANAQRSNKKQNR